MANDTKSPAPESAQAPATEEGDSRRKFDHDLINARLADGVKTRDIVEEVGCSASLVLRLKRRLKGTEDEHTPRNVQRATALRKRIAMFSKDFDLLGAWAHNEESANLMDDEGKPVRPISAIVQKLEEATSLMAEAAEMYEALPAEVMKTKRKAKVIENLGDLLAKAKAEGRKLYVVPKDKYKETYAALVEDGDVSKLEVIQVRTDHAAVKSPGGTSFFMPIKELEQYDEDDSMPDDADADDDSDDEDESEDE